MKNLSLIVALALSMFTEPLAADTIVVPDDAPNLAAAIAVALPGDEIIVRTTANQGRSAGILIDKALTIIGDPVCNIDVTSGFKGIQLAGPGFGMVTLTRVTIDYGSKDASGARTLFGTGFDALHLFESNVLHDNGAFSGLIFESFPGIDLPDISQITLVNSHVTGGPAGTDSNCTDASFYVNGKAAILAPIATVLLIDSTVEGGRGGLAFESTYLSCPSDLSDWGGKGGDGVVAFEVHAWNSTVSGGSGTLWKSYASGLCDTLPLVDCGKQADGSSFVLGGTLVNNLCSTLTQASAAIPLGSTWTLHWTPGQPGCLPSQASCPANCMGFLFFSLAGPRIPTLFQGNWAFLDPAKARMLASFPAATQTQLNFKVPLALGLIGLPLSSQVLISNGELSGPTFGVLVP